MSTLVIPGMIPASAAPLYAGFWRRVAAIFLDGLILLVPELIVKQVVADDLLQLLGIMIIAGAYYAGFHSSSWQGTPGKKYFGIKVTDLAGGRISLGRAIGRFFGLMLSSLTFGLGCIPAAFTKKHQALHDMICGTLVVNRSATTDEIAAGGGGVMPLTAGVWVVMVICFLVPVVGTIAARAYEDYQRRIKVSEVMRASQPLKDGIERAISEKRTWTVGKVLIGSQYASSAEVTPEGQVVVTLTEDLARDGRFRLTPTTTSGGVQWKCTAEGIPPQLLPPSCRQ